MCPWERIPYIQILRAFNKKQLIPNLLRQPEHVLAIVARPNCPRELYPLCSNFKNDGGSLKRQVPRNLRSRTFEGGLRLGYPPRTARLEFHKDANWPRLGYSIKILEQHLLSARRRIPLTIYRNFVAILILRSFIFNISMNIAFFTLKFWFWLLLKIKCIEFCYRAWINEMFSFDILKIEIWRIILYDTISQIYCRMTGTPSYEWQM